MEKIENLPIDKIPLSTEEKDVFQWLYPKKEIINEETNVNESKIKETTINKNTIFYIYMVLFSLSLFSVLYPKTNIFWTKVIPTNENSPFFSIIKIFIVFFILYLVHFGLQKYYK